MSHATPASLLELPINIVEDIVRHLDDESLCKVAAAYPRFRDICQTLLAITSIKTRHVHHLLIRSVSSNGARVRTLDLSGSWSDPESITTMIRKCQNLSELNVVNSSLTPRHLVEVLEVLRSLKNLKATVADADGETRPGSYESIESIYMEFSPKETDARFVIKFLNACPSAKDLRIGVIGYAENRVPSMTQNVEWHIQAGYDSVVIFSDSGNGWSCNIVYSLLFGRSPALHKVLSNFSFRDRVICYEQAGMQDPTRPELSRMFRKTNLFVRPEQKIPPLSDFNDRGHTIGLRVKLSFHGRVPQMPALNSLSSVRELDFGACHLLYSAETWQSLVDTSPQVEALALPSCSLLGAHDASIVDGDILAVLAKLKVKKLHVESFGDDCARCRRKLDGPLMMHLCEFRYLEDFALHKANLTQSFLDHLEKPLPMRTIKLKVDSLGGERKVLKLLGACQNLRNLKLEALDLPLHSSLFWEALSEADLTQLCLASASVLPSSPEFLRRSVSRLFGKLEFFHLHAAHAPSSDMESLIEKEARTANQVRRFQPLHFVVNEKSMANWRNSLGPGLVGRSLCCMENFIAVPKPESWNTDC